MLSAVSASASKWIYHRSFRLQLGCAALALLAATFRFLLPHPGMWTAETATAFGAAAGRLKHGLVHPPCQVGDCDHRLLPPVQRLHAEAGHQSSVAHQRSGGVPRQDGAHPPASTLALHVTLEFSGETTVSWTGMVAGLVPASACTAPTASVKTFTPTEPVEGVVKWAATVGR